MTTVPFYQRALDLAASGWFLSIHGLRTALHSEGYTAEEVHTLHGAAAKKQLQAIIKSAGVDIAEHRTVARLPR